MEQLAADITEAGFVPGLWMAPFYVDRSTDTYLDHSDWWVRDRAGEELTFTNLETGDYAIIDVTHPDAAAWLSDVIAARVADGWVYLKLDFLYAGAQEGLRNADVTGIEAYRIGVELLREAAGEDTWILACGAPMLPSVGFADSFRSGADIAFDFAPDPTPEFLRWQARQTAGRAWSNGRWWWNDADQIMVRDPFDEHWVTGALVSNLVSGGVWMLGDDLTSLAPERAEQALESELVGLRGQLAVPQDPLSLSSGLDGGPLVEQALPNDTVPTTWTLADGTVALLNMTSESITVDGPGGTELLSGETAAAGSRTLAPGAGEVWLP